jgi:maltose alpha-D-glucosyltransferase / alpha-amylase
MKTPGSARDPLWFKDAVIYELYVRAFYDSNNDGIGDFPGLTQKLDYLRDLGVTCLWLLPFFPSPLRDDGYDIADYTDVHPHYGTLDDFRTFLNAAHERDLQVMIELVINHTADQHPWFQAARAAPAGSGERDFYVWNDTDKKYAGVRIIFTDTEKSNWTWDPVAKAYYWHRFFSHQPDLNFDNPRVLEEVQKIMRFWLDMGVDGLRLDAIPYLVERDGTNCENLPETHAVVKQIRGEMDELYAGRMILAEANQWPTDVRAYFGDGDECHMAFHFPLMPRIFMALRLEDRLPITDIIGQTPEIPESCQWGLFLRNHDELTLEMVTDEERDYMYLAYSADPRMRINVGIRRRLAPLMDNNPRRIELMNSLLFSFPGTPILYYGDEIGMGDNIYLGDRNGVRTPMHWSADRNAGFSRATPARLYSPVVMDPVYGYESVNVEAQESDPSSLLSWMRNMIALRKLFRVFGRGSFEFLHPANRKILAYLRRGDDQQILCVANLSRFAQPVELDLHGLEGVRPIEMLGYVEFPAIGQQPYPLTVGPYGFLWFELYRQPQTVEARIGESGEDEPRFVVAGGWKAVLEGPGRQTLETRALPRYLPKQRWFGGKSRRIRSTSVVDWAQIEGTNSALAFVAVVYDDQAAETYLLPLGMRFGSAAADLRATTPHAIVGGIASAEAEGVLFDAVLDDDACAAFLACIDGRREIRTRKGVIRGVPGSMYAEAKGPAETPLAPARGPADHGSSFILYGSRLILKVFHRQEPGPNPDCEVDRYLSERAHFSRVPPFAGSIEYEEEGAETATLALLQGLVPNEGDGWKWNLEELDRYYQDHAHVPFPSGAQPASQSVFDLSETEAPPLAREHLGICLDAAAVLGRRTAEMHLALAMETDDRAFAPEPLRPDDVRHIGTELEEHTALVFERLKESLSNLPDEIVESAGLTLSRRRQWVDRFRLLRDMEIRALRTRIHGDYHLGQVLRAKNDYMILDFAGEPARPLAERREKRSPLEDVAGMLRSFSYAAQVALLNYTTRRPDALDRLDPWARLWERSTAAEFLRAYRATAGNAPFLPADPVGFKTLLEAYLLNKALHELRYELDNRPGWARIPLSGVLSLGI